MCALMCALMCAPVAGVPVAQRISFSSTSNRRYTKYYSPCFGEVANNRRRRPSGTSPYVRPHVVRSLPFHVLSAMARDRGAKCFYPITEHKKKVSGTLHLVQETWRPRKPKVPDTFFCGRPQMPNGPWPGEKTPYFTAKTGHMARHGIWPSDAWVRIRPASRIRIRGTELPKSQAPTLSGVNDRGQGRTRNQEHSCNETRRR